ncbi:MAG TPA: hypothetical protein VH140_06335 [Candidatus Acidoferrum sp.]|jgi:hypothetical protein|nr:hypothetical protein [Candidatus Acidoferrum sp.]
MVSDFPAELRVLSERADKALVVDLTDKEATRIGCRADILARSDGQNSGMVRDSQGRTVENFLVNKPVDPKK